VDCPSNFYSFTDYIKVINTEKFTDENVENNVITLRLECGVSQFEEEVGDVVLTALSTSDSVKS
jgi:hypothetical protein